MLVGTFFKEKALAGSFSVIVKSLRRFVSSSCSEVSTQDMAEDKIQDILTCPSGEILSNFTTRATLTLLTLPYHHFPSRIVKVLLVLDDDNASVVIAV